MNETSCGKLQGITIGTERLRCRLEGILRRSTGSMRNLSFPLLLTYLTTRSLTGVYAEFNEVFEMTGKRLSLRLQGEIFPLSFAFTDSTTRSLTGVYAEFNEVFEMTCCLGSI
jgi:hypothetical protein